MFSRCIGRYDYVPLPVINKTTDLKITGIGKSKFNKCIKAIKVVWSQFIEESNLYSPRPGIALIGPPCLPALDSSIN